MRKAEEADSYVLEVSSRFDDTTSVQTIAFDAPETVYTRTTDEGDVSESLTIGNDQYIRLSSQEPWYVTRNVTFSSPLSGTPLGEEETRDEFVANAQFVGSEESDGRELFRYRYTMDMSFMSEAFSGECRGIEFEFDYGPAVMDLWVDPGNSTVGRWQMTGELTFNGERMTYEGTGEFSNFDGSFPIPTLPADAKDFPDFGFEDIFEECFSPD